MPLGGERQVEIMHTCSLSGTPVIHVANSDIFYDVWKQTSLETH